MTATSTAPRTALHTFEIRPTPSVLPVHDTVDELMIDWGNLPAGSSATIYLPAVSADETLALASAMYVTHRFSRLDANTLACGANGISYLPIPKGPQQQNYAGLLTVTVPAAPAAGQIYSVIVRQVTTGHAALTVTGTDTAEKRTLGRRVLGTFQISLSAKPPDQALLASERLYAVFTWIAEAIAPADRWYPVFLRYLAQLATVITKLGGDPAQIPPSPGGQVLEHPVPAEEAEEIVGKIEGIIYDHFGDFDGFILETETGHHHRFRSRETPMLVLIRRAWEERTRVAVRPDAQHQHQPRSVILLAGGPAP